jgi:hypothetical protein
VGMKAVVRLIFVEDGKERSINAGKLVAWMRVSDSPFALRGAAVRSFWPVSRARRGVR